MAVARRKPPMASSAILKIIVSVGLLVPIETIGRSIDLNGPSPETVS